MIDELELFRWLSVVKDRIETLPVLSAEQITTGTLDPSLIPPIPWDDVLKAGSSLGDLETRSASDLSSGTLPDARMPGLTGDVSSVAGAVATTLATVNTSPGTYGSGDAVPILTVNGKGLVTGVTEQPIVLASGGYTIGDLLVADSPTSLTTLSDVAFGSVLLSGGVGVAPAWSAEPQIGDGRVLGPPVGTIVATDTGVAGNVTGTVKYAYTEMCNGETTISPQTTIAVVNKKVSLVLPAIRRGATSRRIYRTVSGGSTFKLLFEHDGGFGLTQSTYLDNTLDSGLGATAPASDGSKFYNAWINDDVKYISTHPDRGAAAADFALLTTQNDGNTGYATDIYGPIVVRTSDIAQSYNSFGQACAAHFAAYAINPTFGDTTAALVFKIGGLGHTSVSPSVALSDVALGDGKAVAFKVDATFGTANTTAAISTTFNVNGAGNQSFSQTALGSTLAAGYTGSSLTYAIAGQNNTATGPAIGVSGQSAGSATAVGVFGNGNSAASGRHFGGFFTNENINPSTVSAPGGGVTGAALGASNGSGSNDIVVAYDNTDPVFRVTNGGDLVCASPSGDSSYLAQFTATSGGGQVSLTITGGTSCAFGSTNAIPLLLKTNAATVMTLSAAGLVGIGVTPTAVLHLKAGTATANTAPLKLNSGTVLTTAEAGAIEFTTDDFFATITTGAARKAFILDDGARLTSGKIPIATTNGRLIDGQTPLAGTKVYYVSDTSGGAVTRKLTFIAGILTSET